MQFKREISLFGLLLIGIGSIVGSGWLFGPMYAAQIAGPGAIISWLLGGLVMVIIALTFAELGSAYPVAGSMVQVAQYSHGPLISFIIGWMVWISSVAVAPVETMAIIQYSASYIPGLTSRIDNVTVLTYLGMLVAALILLLMCLLNYFSARFFSRSNNVITSIKLIVPVVTFLLLLSIDFHLSNFTNHQTGGFFPYGLHGILTALPLGGIVYSLIGANTILQLAAETDNPQRNIPLALIGATIFCAILYALIQLSFIGALMPESLVNGWKALHFPGDSGPFVGIFTALGLAWFVIILYADALISPFGTAFIYTSATARVNYGLSKIGFFPKSLQQLTRRGVPVRALAVNYLVGLVLFLPFPGWQSLVGFVIVCFIVSYIIGPIALVALRKAQPDYPRPFKLPAATWMSLLAFYICNLMIFWTGWDTVSKMMIVMAIGLIFFAIHCFKMKNDLWKNQWQSSWWILPYFTMIGIISYLGSFGNGLGYISFGMDFAVIAVLSIIIFFLAIKLSQKNPAIHALAGINGF